MHWKNKEVIVLPCLQNYERKVDKQFITTFTAKNTFEHLEAAICAVNNSQGVVGSHQDGPQ